MALPLPPASNLHSILLVTKSRSLGPRLVFHYPPLSPSAAALAANKAPAWFGNDTSTGSIASHSDSSDWDSSTETEDDIEAGSRTSGGRGSGRTTASHREKDRHRPSPGVWGRQESVDEEDADGEDGEGKAAGAGKEKGGDYDWHTVLGFQVDALEKMLCPSKAFNKRRFELGVEGIVFVGAPRFVRDDGYWKKPRRRKEKVAKENLEGSVIKLKVTDSDEDPSPQTVSGSASGRASAEPFEYPVGFEPGYGHGLMSGAASEAQSEAGSDTRSNSTTDNAPDMTMFNIVFVLNPPALEYQLRVKEMYDNVARKFAKALKYEQARHNYIWKESKRVIDIKQRAKENGEPLSVTWHQLINTSLLAKSVAIMFDAISNDKIAHLHFDKHFSTSFQIPQADSTPYLPNALEPQMPGLWLTTSNVVIEEDDYAPMTQHAALLLLEDAETLVKELEGDSKGTTTGLAFYVRTITPTKSLQKISIKHNILAHDMMNIAGHLVYWRRARFIPPLHPRDTYIVSPNADMSALQAAISAYAARFPTLPSLPKILSMLSGTPRPWRTMIPTNEHREAYMEILAWLMRGGWVTQLRTFAWVRVTVEIKAQVAADMEREAREKKIEEERRREMEDNESLSERLFEGDKRTSWMINRPSTPMRRRQDEDHTESNIMLSPRQGPYRGSPARPSSDAGSTSSNRTTIAASSNHPPSPSAQQAKQTQPHRPSPLHLKTTSPSQAPTMAAPFSPPTNPLNTNLLSPSLPSPPLSLQNFTPSLVLSPQKAKEKEARWLEKIGQSFAEEDLRELWPMLLRHLDGRHAIEDIAPREGLKRKRVWNLFHGVRDGGWLVSVRHW
ncbi:nitrogen permease regulator of amino acid transport activity 3-domain-containing protein [Lophiotrema nucula]|uniref:Nitrogen permease regulator 3 n=1 Tax=Lophiotrema nucula TaxID=690887 RepID=A0A6A5ZME4_9PLEO|nr:nitrogen permease regulator of amino acid transport activity 3-domain-containing protein [Lophiotrema nucula]